MLYIGTLNAFYFLPTSNLCKIGVTSFPLILFISIEIDGGMSNINVCVMQQPITKDQF